MLGVRPSREYLVPRLALAAILGGCVGASIAVWRVSGSHSASQATSGPGATPIRSIGPSTGSSVAAGCVTSASGEPPAIAASDSQAGALCEVLQFDRVSADAVRLGPVQYRKIMLEHFASAATAYAEDLIASELKNVEDGSRLVDAGGHVRGFSVNLTSRFDSYSPQVAVVELWGLVVDATDATPPTQLSTTPQATWATDRIHLVYTANGWRVAAIEGTPGPSPLTQKVRVLPGIPDQLNWDPIGSGVAATR